MRDLDEIKKMFIDADNLIREKPELLSMHIDQIFDELDDGTSEMRHIRWGVMTRVKMMEVKSFCELDIINFLMGIKERNLLCRYIGYVLQVECNISLIKLLLKAYESGVHKKILPFAEGWLKYENDCFIDKIDIMLNIIADADSNDKSRLVIEYGSLVLKCDQEELVLEKYIDGYTETLKFLVNYLLHELYPKKEELAKKWLAIYLNEENAHCKIAGISLLSRSLDFGTEIFENYFSFLEEGMCDVPTYWENLIEAYVRYLECDNNDLYKNEVIKRLVEIKNGSIEEKRFLFQELEYKIKLVEEFPELLENVLSNSFDKDIEVLKATDLYFDYLMENNTHKAMDMLYKVYSVNKYKSRDEFLNCLPELCSKARKKQEELLGIWWDKFLRGNEFEFYLSVDIFSNILSLGKLESFFKTRKIFTNEALCLLEGIYLYTIEEKKIVKLVFIIADFIEDKEFYSDYCIKNIFSNYSGALIEEAKRNIENENSNKKVLAEFIIKYYTLFEEKISKGFHEKEFIQPTNRAITYRRALEEQNRKIAKKANEKSIFAQLFTSKKMKYGKRVAFLQKQKKGKYNYNVNEYATNSFSLELPRSFINNPVKYACMRVNYLESRGKNAVNS